jgi:hypothetical protein
MRHKLLSALLLVDHGHPGRFHGPLARLVSQEELDPIAAKQQHDRQAAQDRQLAPLPRHRLERLQIAVATPQTAEEPETDKGVSQRRLSSTVSQVAVSPKSLSSRPFKD